jgi:hypothetical protein
MTASSGRKIFSAAKHLAALLLFLAAFYAFYAPPAGGGFTHFGYADDPLSYIWFLNWPAFAMAHHLSLFFTLFVDAPFGTSLAWKTSVPSLALLAAPFTLRFGALAVCNALFLIAPALTAWGGYLAAAELTGTWLPALLAGFVFGFSGYMVAELLGHLNLVFNPAIPLAVWLVVRAFKHGWSHWRLGLPLGCLLAFQFGVSQEILATFCMFGGLAVLLLLWLHPAARDRLVALVPGLLTGLLLCLILVSPMLWEMLRNMPPPGSIPPAVLFSNDLLGFIVPTPINGPGGRLAAPIAARFPGNLSEQTAYIGLPLAGLLIWLAWRKRGFPALRVLAAFTLLAAVLSLGPQLHVLGTIIGPAPWGLVSGLPLLQDMLPARFMFYGFGAIALMLAYWLAMPGRRAPRYLVTLACLAFWLPDRDVARHWTTLMVPPIFTDGTIPAGSDILILPDMGDEIGYQFAAGMRFRLVGQGYLSATPPQPFAQWPYFDDLFNNRFERIDPKAMASYLSGYGVQEVVITDQVYQDFSFNTVLDTDKARAAALALLLKAGWRVQKTTPHATLLVPPAQPGHAGSP